MLSTVSPAPSQRRAEMAGGEGCSLDGGLVFAEEEEEPAIDVSPQEICESL